jgi:N-acetylglucosamine-6-sulfatase
MLPPRRFLWSGLALAALGVVAAVVLMPAAPRVRPRLARRSDRRPNIVFVLTDDLSWDLLRLMPHVRQLQRDGMTFRQFMVSDSLCCSSRATILTGEFPHDTHVLSNTPPFGGYYAFHAGGADRRSVAISLQRSGYRTALFGKYLNGYQPFREGEDPGWSAWLGSSYAYDGFGYEESVNGHPTFAGYRPRDYVTNALARHARRFIRRSAGRGPFFAEIATYAPHAPFTPAPRDRARFRHLPLPRDGAFDAANTAPPAWLGHRPPLRRDQIAHLRQVYRERARSVLDVDRMIGRLRAELRALGIARNTYIVFSSDNGFHLGQHRLTDGKRTAFDPDIRVPLIVAGPGVAQRRATSAVTGTVDLAPTFEDWARLPVDRQRDGRSLAQLLAGRRPRHWRRTLLIEHTDDAVRPGDPDAQGWAEGKPDSYTALRTRWTTYVEYADGDREFYDRRFDPYELHNRFGQLSAARRDRLSAALARYRGCHGASDCFTAGFSAPLRRHT